MNLRKCVVRGLMSAVIYLGQNFCVGFREWETPSQETIRAQTNEKNLRQHRTEDGTGAPRQDAPPAPLQIRVIKEPEAVPEAAGWRGCVCRKTRANSSPELKVTAGGKKATDDELKPTERSGWSAGSPQWLVLCSWVVWRQRCLPPAELMVQDINTERNIFRLSQTERNLSGF